MSANRTFPHFSPARISFFKVDMNCAMRLRSRHSDTLHIPSRDSHRSAPSDEGSEPRSVDRVWNVMAHAQKPDFVFRRNGRVHLNWWGRQLSRLLAAEVCASAVVMLDTPCSEVVWRVLATHSIRQFPFTSPPVRHRVPSHFNWTLPATTTTGRIIITSQLIVGSWRHIRKLRTEVHRVTKDQSRDLYQQQS
jgi:hypothetical protein